MIPRFIFFPFTHMSQSQMELVLSIAPGFDRLVLDNECIEHENIHAIPVTPEEMLASEQVTDQYLAWAQIHKGNEGNLKALIQDSPYFTNDTDITAIKSQLLNQEDRSGKDADMEDIPKALVFLKMAQLCDAQHDQIDEQLKSLDQTQNQLVNELRGLDTESSQDVPVFSQTDTGDKMTAQRVASWTAYMAGKGYLENQGTPCVFITTSQAVYDWFETNCKDLVNPLDIEQIKVHENVCKNKKQWQDQFCEILEQAVKGKGNQEQGLPGADDGCSLSVQIKLGLFSGNEVSRLFNPPDKQICVCLVRLK